MRFADLCVPLENTPPQILKSPLALKKPSGISMRITPSTLKLTEVKIRAAARLLDALSLFCSNA